MVDIIEEEEIPTEAVDFDEYLDDFGDVVYETEEDEGITVED